MNVRPALAFWLSAAIAAVVLLLPSPPPLAAPAYSTLAATEANNQHKLTAARGLLYMTYSARVGRVLQVVVDVSADRRQWRRLGQVSQGEAPSALSTLVADAAGRLHVAWTRFEGSGRVYYRRYDGRWSPAVALSPATTYAGYPSLDVDSRGRLHLVWYGIRPATAGQATVHGGIYEIFYLTFDGRWSPPRRISTGYPDAINPTVAVDPQGRVHAAWFQSDGQTYQLVYARRTAEWSAPAPVTSAPVNSTTPAIAVDGRGRVHLVWTRPDGVYYSAGGAGGWSRAIRLSTGSGRHPTVGIGPRGPFALWQDENGTIALRAFNGRWGPPQRVGEGDHPNAAPWRPHAAVRPVAVWTAGSGIKAAELPVPR